MKRVPALLLIVSLALFAGGLLYYLGAPFAAYQSQDSVGTAAIGGPFALTDQNGTPRLDKDFHGKYVLLYFGYRFCPDVCPTTLSMEADALSRLGPKARDIVPVFVTIDPERDTPAALKKYLASFGPEFVGLTGSLGAITAVAHEYRVYFAKHPLEGGGYAVDHSSVLYLLGPDGKLVKFYDQTMTPDALAKDLASRV
jgi:cytochrome oxidase Cu insertion factor (SCO1/SenC/PrrC family)